MKEYQQFIRDKAITSLYTDSIQVNASDLNPKLYPFQRDIVRWALAKGRAAIFADCGLGKTPMQLEWAHRVVTERGGMVLILAPLAVAGQTAAEGVKFGIDVTICETKADLKPGINITNYEKLGKFEGVSLCAPQWTCTSKMERKRASASTAPNAGRRWTPLEPASYADFRSEKEELHE